MLLFAVVGYMESLCWKLQRNALINAAVRTIRPYIYYMLHWISHPLALFKQLETRCNKELPNKHTHGRINLTASGGWEAYRPKGVLSRYENPHSSAPT